MRKTLLMFAVLSCAACGREGVNPPTEPAAPVTSLDAEAPPPAPQPGLDPIMPGAGPPTFVGRWAGRATWCANTAGEQQPVEISPTEFRGYENRCRITHLAQAGAGYDATLQCLSEGLTANERARFSVAGNQLDILWIDRDGATTQLWRCPDPLAGATPPS